MKIDFEEMKEFADRYGIGIKKDKNSIGGYSCTGEGGAYDLLYEKHNKDLINKYFMPPSSEVILNDLKEKNLLVVSVDFIRTDDENHPIEFKIMTESLK